jgi:hypothetical protein
MTKAVAIIAPTSPGGQCLTINRPSSPPTVIGSSDSGTEQPLPAVPAATSTAIIVSRLLVVGAATAQISSPDVKKNLSEVGVESPK